MRRTLNLSGALFGAIIVLLAGLNRYVYTDLRDAAIAEATAALERQVQSRRRISAIRCRAPASNWNSLPYRWNWPGVTAAPSTII